jgi:hypothetical protein
VVSVKVLSAFSRAKPLAEATLIFDGHDLMLDMRMSSWEKAYLANINSLLATMQLKTWLRVICICVMWNIEDDDALDVRNFIPADLVKVANNICKVMDDKDDVCFEILTKDSLSEMWGNEVRFPCTNFVQHCKDNCLFFDGSNQRIDGLGHEVSPCHQGLHEEAAQNMDRSSRKVMKRIKSKSAVVEIGDVVQVSFVQQD